ncbi:hypothetical protein QTG54_004315 [Skeletonema marinoi]|uniref:Uncharacterized protein n=1 Tax=Skeletonema marinoi TaxID=267567 RepID=A0AAD8YGA8_9STRA|nr:hypothetical protein QTG54_004315 [Skeletonema marinoi]
MRADAAPFVPSVLLNSSSTYDGCAEQKKEQQQQRQGRRRRRGKQGSSSGKDPQQPKQNNEPHNSSQSTQKQKLQQHRKMRPRRRKPSSQNSEDAQLQSLNSSIDAGQHSEVTSEEQNTLLEDCFPVLATDYNDSRTTSNTRVDSSWGECLATKLATSEMEQQQQQEDEIHNDQDEFGLQFNSDVQLTKLSKPSYRVIKDDVVEAQNNAAADANENIDNVQSIEDESNCTLFPNARWKWNDTQLSKMRQRWWNAVKISKYRMQR